MNLDRKDDGGTVRLELDTQPEIFRDLERAWLKIGYVSPADVFVSIRDICELGVALFVEYCPSNVHPNDFEKSLSPFNGNVFIPMQRLISINSLDRSIVSGAHVNQAIQNGEVKRVKTK